jgi:hypothetical protein
MPLQASERQSGWVWGQSTTEIGAAILMEVISETTCQSSFGAYFSLVLKEAAGAGLFLPSVEDPCCGNCVPCV